MVKIIIENDERTIVLEKYKSADWRQVPNCRLYIEALDINNNKTIYFPRDTDFVTLKEVDE